MSWPVPQPGLVIRYSYLWEREAREGKEEGVKDRPSAVVLVLLREGEAPIVRVLPVTHSAPANSADALEIPFATKQRLGLDAERSWVVLTEANELHLAGAGSAPKRQWRPEERRLWHVAARIHESAARAHDPEMAD